MPAKSALVKAELADEFDWVNQTVFDECLHQTLWEALSARGGARKIGALHRRECMRAFESGDAILRQIKRVVDGGGPYTKDLYRKAAVAVRKYNTAGECVVPSHLRKRKSA